MMEQTYFRKGFGLKQAIADTLTEDYHSQLVDHIRNNEYELTVGDLTFRLAKEFGFCYGVDRAVEYAYETRRKFPDQPVYLIGEIIHNPHVNSKLQDMGVTVIRQHGDGSFDFSGITRDDVVLIPAFGVKVEDFKYLHELGCVLVDTTCGSVLNVWKRVERYARDGFTAVVHGKYFHEETKATASQVTKYEGGQYIIVRNMAEAEVVCRFIEDDGETQALETQFERQVSPGFKFRRDLVRVGIANQTTMLASESLAIANRIGKSMVARYGSENLADHFRSFDTICSATQERQDAVVDLIDGDLDAMVVIGGYNSSNTNHLAKICAKKRVTYHISDACCIDVESGSINYKPADSTDEVKKAAWLDESIRVIGITAGASTPNNKIGEAIENILRSKGLPVPI